MWVKHYVTRNGTLVTEIPAAMIGEIGSPVETIIVHVSSSNHVPSRATFRDTTAPITPSELKALLDSASTGRAVTGKAHWYGLRNKFNGIDHQNLLAQEYSGKCGKGDARFEKYAHFVLRKNDVLLKVGPSLNIVVDDPGVEGNPGPAAPRGLRHSYPARG